MNNKTTPQSSSRFSFSREYASEKLNGLIAEIRVLYQTILDLPVLPELAARIDEEVIIKSIFSTAALEGRRIAEKKVAEILSRPVGEKKPKRMEKGIENLKIAYDYIAGMEITESPLKLTEKIIKKIHAIITDDLKYSANVPGQYRGHAVRTKGRGGRYSPPKNLDDIKAMMKNYLKWINSKQLLELNALIRAALAHYYLGLIHPFSDGNGLAARIIEALLIRSAGIKYVPAMLSIYYYRNMNGYLGIFSDARNDKDSEVTHFLEFALRGSLASLNEMEGKMTLNIRKHNLRDYYDYFKTKKEITQRQYDLLNMLIDYLKPFAMEDMFHTSPFNLLYGKLSEGDARRDLDYLCNKNLLVLKDGRHELHLRVLG